MIHHPRSPTPWPALKRGLAGPSDAEAQRRLVEFGNEVEEVAHEALLLMFREVRRFVSSPPYDFLRLTPTFWCCEAYDAFCVSLSIGSIAPEIDLPASEARKTANVAISRGSTNRWSDWTDIADSFLLPPIYRSVSHGPRGLSVSVDPWRRPAESHWHECRIRPVRWRVCW
jgi:hypothetical protein